MKKKSDSKCKLYIYKCVCVWFKVGHKYERVDKDRVWLLLLLLLLQQHIVVVHAYTMVNCISLNTHTYRYTTQPGSHKYIHFRYGHHHYTTHITTTIVCAILASVEIMMMMMMMSKCTYITVHTPDHYSSHTCFVTINSFIRYLSLQYLISK